MSSHEDENILAKEVESWKGFEYALRKPNATLFNKMLTFAIVSEWFSRSIHGIRGIKYLFVTIKPTMSVMIPNS
jgi:hypothetical protein